MQQSIKVVILTNTRLPQSSQSLSDLSCQRTVIPGGAKNKKNSVFFTESCCKLPEYQLNMV